tara:strand:+ start:1798 stop:2103 length:306 start_codon:yes stop_codon:yes gene_type:complete
MSKSRQGVSITLLDKEYIVGCSEDERSELIASANYLNTKMIEQRDTGKVVGSEKIAVMAALNVTNEYLRMSSQSKLEKEDYRINISRISEKITKALTFRRA